MKIIEKAYAWAYALETRTTTKRLTLHHAAAVSCTADDIHRWHLANGWTGFGYHFLVSKDGTVTRGRPINTVGAHTYGCNRDSVAICFEGNFEIETMPAVQLQAGRELVQYVLAFYPTITEIEGHKHYDSTACPGKNFPFDEIVSGKKDSGTATTAVAGKDVEELTINVLGVGDSGEDVRALQILLKGRGQSLATYGADGDFGSETEKAVKAFQTAQKIDVDGIAGKYTFAKLLGV